MNLKWVLSVCLGASFLPISSSANCLSSLTRLLRPGSDVHRYDWDGPIPSEAEWKLATKVAGANRMPPLDAPLTRLFYGYLQKHGAVQRGGEFFYEGQHISPMEMGSEDWDLISMSDLNRRPRETWRMEVEFTDGTVLRTEVHAGQETVAVDNGRLMSVITQAHASAGGKVVAHVRFTHSHPIPQYAYPVANGVVQRPSPLSPSDQDSAKFLSHHLGIIPYSVRAVTSEGIAYEQVYKEGRDITVGYFTDP